MADFRESFNKVILAEGGYVNDPDDKGGETYLGISRVNHPYSVMWEIIDAIKKEKGTKNINVILKKDERLIKEAGNPKNKHYYDANMAIIERVWGKATQPIDVESENTITVVIPDALKDIAK